MLSHHRMPKWLFAMLQALFVALYVLGAFLAIYRFHSKLAMASLAASTFIAFAFPLAETSRSRYFIGGYLCGVIFGGALCLLRYELPQSAQDNDYLLIGFCALGVFLTVFAMVLLRLQHPSACAIAIAMMVEGDPIGMGVSTVLAIAGLCFVRWLMVKVLKPYMPESTIAHPNGPEADDQADGAPLENVPVIDFTLSDSDTRLPKAE